MIEEVAVPNPATARLLAAGEVYCGDVGAVPSVGAEKPIPYVTTEGRVSSSPRDARPCSS